MDIPRRNSARCCLVAMGIGVVVSGCGADTGGVWGDATSVRDSAGIVVVENAAPRWDDPAWTVELPPEVKIVTPEQSAAPQLFRVVGARRLADGRVVVANSGTGELLFFDPSGSFIQAAGGLGEGPGEFRRLDVLLRLSGDSLLVFDRALSRFSIFDRDGSFVRSFVGGQRGVRPLAAIGPGRLLAATAERVSAAELESGIRQGSEKLVVIDLEGNELWAVAQVLSSEAFIKTDGASIQIVPLPFARRGRFAAASEQIYYGWNDRPEIRTYKVQGDLERLIRLGEVDRAVTPEDVQLWIEQTLAAMGDPAEVRRVESSYGEADLHESVPAFDEMVVDADGYLWVQRFQRPDETHNMWGLYTGEGRWVGAASLPLGLRVLEIGADYILGLREDDLGVESVEFYSWDR